MLFRKKLLGRGPFLGLALLCVAVGLAWNIFQDRVDSGLRFPTRGYVASVRRDSVGCDSRLPFAARDCRYVIRIHHRVDGTAVEQSYIHVAKYYFLPGPRLQGGEAVEGECVAATGRCEFAQLAEKQWTVYLAGACLAGAAGIGAWLAFRRMRRS